MAVFRIQPGHINFNIKVTDIANDRFVFSTNGNVFQ
jgi:hypothetical protein